MLNIRKIKKWTNLAELNYYYQFDDNSFYEFNIFWKNWIDVPLSVISKNVNIKDIENNMIVKPLIINWEEILIDSNIFKFVKFLYENWYYPFSSCWGSINANINKYRKIKKQWVIDKGNFLLLSDDHPNNIPYICLIKNKKLLNLIKKYNLKKHFDIMNIRKNVLCFYPKNKDFLNCKKKIERDTNFYKLLKKYFSFSNYQNDSINQDFQLNL